MPITAAPSCFYLDSKIARIFCLARGLEQPQNHASSHAVLIVPPFAEEMNRSRRLMTLTGMALAKSKVSSLIFDPYGCGDSDGAFSDARWSIWQQDLLCALAWLREHGAQHVKICGFRLGALLALSALTKENDPNVGFCLVAPQLDGAKAMRQFLRIRVASDMEAGITSGKTGLTLSEIETKLDGGEMVEIAGYGLAPELYTAINGQHLKMLNVTATAPLHIIECSETRAPASPAALKLMEDMNSLGLRPILSELEGPCVWQQLEPAPAGPLASALAMHLTRMNPYA